MRDLNKSKKKTFHIIIIKLKKPSYTINTKSVDYHSLADLLKMIRKKDRETFKVIRKEFKNNFVAPNVYVLVFFTDFIFRVIQRNNTRHTCAPVLDEKRIPRWRVVLLRQILVFSPQFSDRR